MQAAEQTGKYGHIYILLTYWGRDKMAALSQQRFQRHFFNENVWILIKISLKFVPKGSNWQYYKIGSDNGLALTRRQAIILTNDG